MVKTLQYDLPVVASFAPGIVIVQLRTNQDLSRLDPLVVGSFIEELVIILHDTYNVSLFVSVDKPFGDPILYSTLRVRALNRYVKTFLEALPYVFSGGIEAFGIHPRDFSLVMVSTSLGRGNISLSESQRVVLKSLRLCSVVNYHAEIYCL